MPATQPSWGDVFQGIVSNIQEIVRSGIRLAEAEAREETQALGKAGASLESERGEPPRRGPAGREHDGGAEDRAMGEESRELKHRIDETRCELGRNIRVLDRKVRTALEWRVRFREHPVRMLWMAFGLGVLLAGATSGRPARRAK